MVLVIFCRLDFVSLRYDNRENFGYPAVAVTPLITAFRWNSLVLDPLEISLTRTVDSFLGPYRFRQSPGNARQLPRWTTIKSFAYGKIPRVGTLIRGVFWTNRGRDNSFGDSSSFDTALLSFWAGGCEDFFT